jgi:hypothetical protein
MKNHISSNQATFGPQHYKSFEGALEAFFYQECPQIGGTRTRQVLVQTISTMVKEFFPQTSHLKPGQTTWVTVDKNETSSYGKKIQNTRLKPVVLDLVQSCDVQDRAHGKKLREIKQEASVRINMQAYEQGGCLTNAETAVLLKLSPGTVSKYIREWEETNNAIVPRRGSVHDIGPTLTHKKMIIHKLFIEQKSVQTVSQETCHSFEAIQRYISTFKQILLCKKKGFSTKQIAFAIKKTERLVIEYEKIIDNYEKQKPLTDEILNFEVDIKEKDYYSYY